MGFYFLLVIAFLSHLCYNKYNTFPCDMLKEWASSENTDRIQNLVDLNNQENN